MPEREIIPVADLSEKAWLELRRTGIGGSQAAAVVGMSPWASPFNVWSEIVEGYRQPETEQMRRGNLLEPVAAAVFTADSGLKLLPSIFARHPGHPWMIGTPDRLIEGGKAGWEGKSADPWTRKKWGEPGTDQVPVHYLLQCHHYMAVMNINLWYLTCFFSRDEVPTYKIARDYELEKRLIERLGAFWREYIQPKIAPDFLQAKQLKEYVARKYPVDILPVREAEEDDIPFLEVLRETRDLCNIADARREVAEAAVKMLIGEHAGVKTDDESVTWKKSKDREKIDWHGVAKFLMDEEGLPAERCQEIIGWNTERVEGSRRLVVPRSWKALPVVKDVKLLKEGEVEDGRAGDGDGKGAADGV